jgi:hypothetical protein
MVVIMGFDLLVDYGLVGLVAPDRGSTSIGTSKVIGSDLELAWDQDGISTFAT